MAPHLCTAGGHGVHSFSSHNAQHCTSGKEKQRFQYAANVPVSGTELSPVDVRTTSSVKVSMPTEEKMKHIDKKVEYTLCNSKCETAETVAV